MIWVLELRNLQRRKKKISGNCYHVGGVKNYRKTQNSNGLCALKVLYLNWIGSNWIQICVI